MPLPSKLSTVARIALSFAFLCSGLNSETVTAKDGRVQSFSLRAPVPLGVEALRLRPIERRCFLMVSVVNPGLDGVHVVRALRNGSVTTSDGMPMRDYPAVLEFRVTASAMNDDLIGFDYNSVNGVRDLNEFLLGLRFRLKIHRGLHMTIVRPVNVNIIGVPADQEFDERVFAVAFDTHQIPVDARIVLEVLTPKGERLARFHLELL